MTMASMMPATSNDPMQLQQPQQPVSALTSEKAIEQHLLEAFSKLKTPDGQLLDVRSALSDLTLIIICTEENREVKKFMFLGEAAAQFAVACLLMKHHTDMNIDVIKALTKKYQCALPQLYKVVRKQLALSPLFKAFGKQTVDKGTRLTDSMNAIIGALYLHCGSNAVEMILNDALIAMSDQELNQNLPLKVKNAILNQEMNVLSKFNTFLQSYKAVSSCVYTQLLNQSWHCELKFRFPKARTFSHQAMGSSKNESRATAARQILELVEQRPDALQELLKPAAAEEQEKVYTLPIELPPSLTYALQQQQQQQSQQSQQNSMPSTFMHTESQNTVFTDQASLPSTPATNPAFTNNELMRLNPIKTETTGDWQVDANSNRFFIGDTSDEETIRLMSELILGPEKIAAANMNSIAARTGDVVMDVDNEEMNLNNKRVRINHGSVLGTSNGTKPPSSLYSSSPNHLQQQQQQGNYFAQQETTMASPEAQIKMEEQNDAAYEALLRSTTLNVNSTASPTAVQNATIDPFLQLQKLQQQQQQLPTQAQQFAQFHSPEIADKVVKLFAQIFMADRKLLNQTREIDYQSVFRTLVINKKDQVSVDSKVEQIGTSHAPLFNSEVVLKYNEQPAYFIRCTATAKRKKEAERMAWSQLVNLIRCC